MISTHNLFHGVSSAILAGILPYFFVEHSIRCHVSHPVTPPWTAFLMPGQYKCWIIIVSNRSSPG